MKKTLDVSGVVNELKGSSGFFQTTKQEPSPPVTSNPTSSSTSVRDGSRDMVRNKPRAKSRKQSRNLPTRDEIQEFSFRLRDELKVKVQAEVPHTWQKELDTVARRLDVKKLELYRFILGEFLGKVNQGESS